jgi:hypothetical protein
VRNLFLLVVFGIFFQSNVVSASANQCAKLFTEVVASSNQKAPKDTSYVEDLNSNIDLVPEIQFARSNTDLKSPVPVSAKINAFRARLLPYLKNPVLREPIIRSFEAALRIRSKILAKKLIQSDRYAQYDVVIVGAGIHGVIALNRILAKNPNLKVLIIEESDTAASTFRYAKEAFSINSSNRASGKGSKPLPGEGNINELPGLPIQLSDLTNVKYPSANDLGIAINAGLYAAVREYPNVDVLFNSSVKNLLESAKDQRFSESLEVSVGSKKSQIVRIDAQRVFVTTGLGRPGLPDNLRLGVAAEPSLLKSIDGAVPKVITFEDIMRAIGSSNNPLAMFAGKKIAVVGSGDSANVFIEFLLGYAPREGYASSTSQNGRPSKIIWIGQSKTTCGEFIAKIRSRYQQISTGFRSSSKNVEELIEAVPPKLDTVVLDQTTGQVKLKIDRTDLSLSYRGSEDNLIADMVIVTTGFDQSLRGLLKMVTQGQSTKFGSDADFFNSDLVETLTATTSVSEQKTRVARRLKNREIYVLGTAAGKLAADNELVGIIQNFVSIFNNAPRVLAGVDIANKDLQPRAQTAGTQAKISIPVGLVKFGNYRITEIQETRLMPTQTVSFLKSIINEALSQMAPIENTKINLAIRQMDNGDLLVRTNSTLAEEALVNLLTESREFFSIAATILNARPGQTIRIEANSFDGNFETSLTQLGLSPTRIEGLVDSENLTIVKNRQIRLRGLEPVDSVSVSEAQKILTVQRLSRAIDRYQTAEVIEILSDMSLNLNFKDANGNYIIHKLVKFSNVEIFKLALKNPTIDLNVKNSDGLAPIFLAVEGVYLKDILLLLAKDDRVKLNVKDNYGYSLKELIAYTRSRDRKLDKALKARGFK